MRIESAKFKNFCQHESLSVKFGPGVIGVMGPNGSGKSNLLGGIKRAFTGQSDNVGKNEDDLRWGADSGSVQVEFTIGQVAGQIKRNLSSSTCSMEFGDKKIRKATEIDAEIYKILGVSPRVLSDIVFIKQFQIETILFQRPAERAKAMAGLFRTDEAEHIREALLEDLKTVVIVSNADNIALKTKTLNDLAELVKVDTREWEEIKDKVLSDKEVLELQQQVAKKGDFDRYVATLESCTTQLESTEKEHVAVRTQYEAKLKSATDLRAILNELLPDVTKARERINLSHAAKSATAQRASLENTIQYYESLLAKEEPKPPHDIESLAQTEKDITDLLPRVSTARAVIKAFAAGGAQTCPTCRQSVPEEFLQRQRMIDAQEGVQLSHFQDKKSRLEKEKWNYNRDHANWVAEQNSSKQAIATAYTQLAASSPLEEVPPSQLQADQALITEYEDTQRICVNDEASVQAIATNLQHLHHRISDLNEKITKLQPVSPGAYDHRTVVESETKLNQHNAVAAKFATVVERMRLRVQQHEALAAETTILIEKENTLAGAKKYKDLAERTRMLFHADRLPNMVAQGFIKALNNRLGKYIEMFEVPFTARMNPDFSMICTFPSKPEVMAERLSGGQRVMLGIAFRFAVYDQFVNDLGLMVLDEPTIALDNDRIESVFTLLSRVKSYSQAAGLQLIVVTHEQRLQGVFDQVIRLGQ